MIKNYWYWILPIGVMVIIFIASSQPYEQQDLRPSLNLYLPLDLLRPIVEPVNFTYHGEVVSVATHGVAGVIEFFIRKGAHLTVFFLLMVTTFLAFHKNTVWKFRAKVMISFIITVIYAAFDEFHQSLTPNRTPYAGDVVLDSIGGLIGCLLIALIFRRR